MRREATTDPHDLDLLSEEEWQEVRAKTKKENAERLRELSELKWIAAEDERMAKMVVPPKEQRQNVKDVGEKCDRSGYKCPRCPGFLYPSSFYGEAGQKTLRCTTCYCAVQRWMTHTEFLMKNALGVSVYWHERGYIIRPVSTAGTQGPIFLPSPTEKSTTIRVYDRSSPSGRIVAPWDHPLHPDYVAPEKGPIIVEGNYDFSKEDEDDLWAAERFKDHDDYKSYKEWAEAQGWCTSFNNKKSLALLKKEMAEEGFVFGPLGLATMAIFPVPQAA